MSVVSKIRMAQKGSQVSRADCMDPFKQFMECARGAIQQREFEQKFTIT